MRFWRRAVHSADRIGSDRQLGCAASECGTPNGKAHASCRAACAARTQRSDSARSPAACPPVSECVTARSLLRLRANGTVLQSLTIQRATVRAVQRYANVHRGIHRNKQLEHGSIYIACAVRDAACSLRTLWTAHHSLTCSPSANDAVACDKTERACAVYPCGSEQDSREATACYSGGATAAWKQPSGHWAAESTRAERNHTAVEKGVRASVRAD